MNRIQSVLSGFTVKWHKTIDGGPKRKAEGSLGAQRQETGNSGTLKRS